LPLNITTGVLRLITAKEGNKTAQKTGENYLANKHNQP